MSNPAHDDFLQTLSDDEESKHEDASAMVRNLNNNIPMIPLKLTAISTYKLHILEKVEFDIMGQWRWSITLSTLKMKYGRVFEQEIQGASKTSSSAQNVAFVSQSKSSTNKVKSGFSGAYSSCTPSTSSPIFLKKKFSLIDDDSIEGDGHQLANGT
ncbi:hypothetical protein Tco_1009922 [Tanacetum coccineum]